jgi:hypothetical protein
MEQEEARLAKNNAAFMENLHIIREAFEKKDNRLKSYIKNVYQHNFGWGLREDHWEDIIDGVGIMSGLIDEDDDRVRLGCDDAIERMCDECVCDECKNSAIGYSSRAIILNLLGLGAYDTGLAENLHKNVMAELS